MSGRRAAAATGGGGGGRAPRKRKAAAASSDDDEAAGGSPTTTSTASLDRQQQQDAELARQLQQEQQAPTRQRSARQKSVKYTEERFDWEKTSYKEQREGAGRNRAKDGSGSERSKRQANGAAGSDAAAGEQAVDKQQQQQAEDGDASEKEDAWEAHCRVCHSDDNPTKLLCCEHCPAVYHLYCLDPPLSRCPAGDWYCPHCTKKFQYQDIERVLDYRDVPVLPPEPAKAPPGKQAKQQQQQQGVKAEPKAEQAEAGPSADVKAEGKEEPAAAADTAAGSSGAAGGEAPPVRMRREYYVKWKGESYLHCSWEPEEDMAAMYKLFPAIRSRVQRFWKQHESHLAEDKEAEETGEFVHGVNPQWLEVDRVLAEQEAEGQPDGRQPDKQPGGGGASKKGGGGKPAARKEFLVKWKEQGYEQCTWELDTDMVAFGDAIRKFRSARSIVEDARARKAAAQAAAVKEQEGPARKKHKKDSAATTAAAAAAAAVDNTPAGTGAPGDPKVQGVGSRKWQASPDFLTGTLHPYQLEGLNWLYYKHAVDEAVILADEMGLGKTVQTIALLASLYEDFYEVPHLVVVPLSTMRNWEREFESWAPHLNVVALAGNAEARRMILDYELFVPTSQSGSKAKASQQDRAKFHVLLTSYEMLAAEANFLSKLVWGVLVVDEGHRLKSKDSKLFQLLQMFSVGHKVILTGTPLQNHLGELFMLMHFLEPDKFPSRADWDAKFNNLGDNEQVGQLHAMLQPHMLRRLKHDVLRQLPPKQEQMVRVELSAVQKDYYKSLLARHYPVLLNSGKGGGGEARATGALKNLVMELRKACNHPFLFTPGHGAPGHPADLASLISASGKLELVDKMAARLRAGGHRLIIFSQFTRMLDLLEEWLQARAWGYMRIDGTVAGPERQKRIDRFNQQPDSLFCFLLSTRAGGMGINLATADTVIIYDSDWNPHNDLQAMARAHRLGQQKPVMIYRLVTRATIEERMIQVSRKKMLLEHLVVRKMGSAGDLKQSELDDILRYGAQELFADEPSKDAAPAATAAAGGPAVADGSGAAPKEEPGAADGSAAATAGGQDVAANGTAAPAPVATVAAAAAAKSRVIVYDDSAIERLLDRSELMGQKGGGDGSDEHPAGDDLFSAFKVANFEMVEVAEEAAGSASGDDGEAEPAAAANAGAAAVPEQLLEQVCPDQGGDVGAGFWEALLRGRYDEVAALEAAAQEMQQAELGKGRRERKKVSYREDVAGADPTRDDNEYDPTGASSSGDESLSSGDEAAPGANPEGRAAKRQRSMSGQPERERERAAAAKRAADGLPPRMSGSGPSLQVYGLSARDRTTFITALMRHGLQASETDPEAMYRAFCLRLPSRPAAAVREYTNVLIQSISEELGPNGKWSNGLSPEDLLGPHRPNDVLERIGFLHLVRRKMTEFGDKPLSEFTLPGAAAVRSLQGQRVWRHCNDGALMRGLVKHGYGQWQKIVKDPDLGVKEPLRREMNVPLDFDAAVSAAVVGAAADISATADAGAAADAGAGAVADIVDLAGAAEEPAAEDGTTAALPAAPASNASADGATLAATASVVVAGAGGSGNAAGGPALSTAKVRNMLSNESRWLIRRLQSISEALNLEFNVQPQQPAAQAKPAAATAAASAHPAAAGGATAVRTAHRVPSAPAAARAPAASTAPAPAQDLFLANIISHKPDYPAANPHERLLKSRIVEQFNMMCRTVAQIRQDTQAASQRAARDGPSAMGHAAQVFRQQVAVLEALARDMTLLLPSQGVTMSHAAPGIWMQLQAAMHNQQAAMQQQQAAMQQHVAAAQHAHLQQAVAVQQAHMLQQQQQQVAAAQQRMVQHQQQAALVAAQQKAAQQQQAAAAVPVVRPPPSAVPVASAAHRKPAPGSAPVAVALAPPAAGPAAGAPAAAVAAAVKAAAAPTPPIPISAPEVVELLDDD